MRFRHGLLENVRPGRYLAFTVGKEGIWEMAEVTMLFGSNKSVHDLAINRAEPNWRSESGSKKAAQGAEPRAESPTPVS
jgi:hypothetical protein